LKGIGSETSINFNGIVQKLKNYVT